MHIVYIAASIDGYIARTDQSLDRLDSFPNPQGYDYGYQEFVKSIGTIVMGRKTYEHLLTLITPDERPYGGMTTVIVSHHTKLDIIITPDTHHRTGEISSVSTYCQQFSPKHTRILGGGELIASFLDHDMVDRMIVTTIPVMLGQGIQLFPPRYPPHDIQRTTQIQQYDNGVFTTTYDRKIKI